MGNKDPATVIRVRALNRLKTALKRGGLTSTVESSGSRIVLHMRSPGIDVDCRTNPSDDHRWWFWLDYKPIGPADEPSAAVEAIKRRHTQERGT